MRKIEARSDEKASWMHRARDSKELARGPPRASWVPFSGQSPVVEFPPEEESQAFCRHTQSEGNRALAGLVWSLFPFAKHDFCALRVRARLVRSRALPSSGRSLERDRGRNGDDQRRSDADRATGSGGDRAQECSPLGEGSAGTVGPWLSTIR